MELGNALNWFEIPVEDFDRAKRFYQAIFAFEMPESQMDEARMGFFLYDVNAGKVGGAIVYHPNFFKPSTGGTLVYLNGQPDLQIVLDRVESAGGKILQQKTLISQEQDMGYWAMFTDSENNRVGLHSMG